MTGHVFVDESKQRNYLLVAAVVRPGDLAAARGLRALVMPGQWRLRMKKESAARCSLVPLPLDERKVIARRLDRRDGHLDAAGS